MADGRFASAFTRYSVRHKPAGGASEWLDIPALSIKVKKSADDLTGTFEAEYPNPRGAYQGTFTNYDYLEIWLANLNLNTMYQVLCGHINNVESDALKMTIKLNGRSLSGFMTDKKIDDSYSEDRVDYILADETFGIIPTYLDSRISTWNAFTTDYDRFDNWDTTRWGAQPAYCTITDDGEMTFIGSGGATRTLIGSTAYQFKTFTCKLKVSAAANYVRFGFTNAGRTNYVQYEITATGLNAETNDGSEQSNVVSGPPTVTNYNYYRIEWAGNLARFYVNGVLKTEETLNVPTASLKPFFESVTNTSVITCDYMKVIDLTQKLDRFIFKNSLAIDAIQSMCDIGSDSAQYSFYIDNDWDFHAIVGSANPSGYSFGHNSTVYTANSQQISGLKYGLEGKELFNKVTITGGDELIEVASPNWTESGKGDGTTVSFNMGYKAKKPFSALEVDSVAKTEDTHYTVIYGKEVAIVTFTTAPASTKVITYRYDKLMPIKVTQTNQQSIDEYGVTREYQTNDESINTREQANKIAVSLLTFFKNPRNVITIEIPMNPQLEIGSTVNIDAPDYGIVTTAYEIAEIEHEMGRGKFNTKLSLVNAAINTLGETVKEMWQQIKDFSKATNLVSTDTGEINTQQTIQGKDFYKNIVEQESIKQPLSIQRIIMEGVPTSAATNGKLIKG